jgi:uncharacterized membrane protein YbaN (DUF454 family)
MKSNTQIVGAVLAGLCTLVLANHFQSNRKLTKKLVTKKLAKEAVQSWEGEGGALVDPAPRPSAG